MKKYVYLDYAAATPIDPIIRDFYVKQLEKYGNSSSLHKIGREAAKELEKSRRAIAEVLNSRPEEIIFTGSGTESNNLAILGVARANKNKGRHLITTQIEHKSVSDVFEHLGKEGFKITYIGVNNSGLVNPGDIAKSIRRDTTLISVICASNEIGTIQPISKIGEVIKKKRKETGAPAFFHTDACQASGFLPLDANKLNVDLMTINSSKIYGPKGAACLYIKRGIELEPVLYGGDHERGLRPGTVNVPAISAFAEALKIADFRKTGESKQLLKLRNYLIGELLKIPGASINGDIKNRLPNNINVSFKGIAGEMLVLLLDKNGVGVSIGSACTANETGPSHVLKAIGATKNDNIRITMGRWTTKEEIVRATPIIIDCVQKLWRLDQNPN
ncbi:MAG: cysteine desulfurase [Parcubacteria group bacterium Licking1014_17]|nr:MAG: cysteine desulfurase [Parcubacteria group bacterium Licking1014_17]